MTANQLELRFLHMLRRLADVYDGIGHSSGRPYVYFVYAPAQEQAVRRLLGDHLGGDPSLSFLPIDLLPLTLHSLDGQEERRRELLEDPLKGSGAAASIVRLWARRIRAAVEDELVQGRAQGRQGRPVVVLLGMAALYPLGNPTMLMEGLAEQEPRDPATGRVVPFVLLVPGTHPPDASRTYCFLGREDQMLTFYRGEEL